MLKYGLFPGPSPSAAHYGTQHIKSAAKSISKNDFEKCASFWNTSRGNQGNNKRVQKHYNLLFFYFYPKRPAFYRLFGAFLYIYYLIIFCVGRIGGMLAPWIGQLSTVHHYLPVSVFGICTILGRSKAILFSCSIPIIEEELIQKRR